MKKQFILFLSFSVFFNNSCIEEGPYGENDLETAPLLAISGFSPSSAECGTEILLYGENFGTSNSENFITFDPWGSDAHSGRIAEVKASLPGMLTVRIPMDLNPGDYQISLQVKGKASRTDQAFRLIGN